MLKIYREVMRFSEKSFISILNEPEIIETMYEYDIHILIFLCISQNFNKVSYFSNLYLNFKFIDYDLLYTIYYLWSSKDYMPNLREFFTKSKQMLTNKYKLEIVDDYYYFPIEIKNFKIPNLAALEKAKDLLKPLMIYDVNSIIEEGKLKQFEYEYNYLITNDGITISAPGLFQILFKALRKDTEAIRDIISIVCPLLRDIPGAVVIFNIISSLTKSEINKVINMMPNLVRIMLLTKLNLSTNLSEKEIEEKIKQLQFTESLVEGVVAWISSLVMLINKNTSQFDIEFFKEIFVKMFNALKKYEDEVGAQSNLAKSALKQANFILMILGLWRGNFDMIASLASEIGVFDGKVKELFSIFAKYKDIIFRNGVVGLPPLRKNIIEAQLKQGLNLAADQAKRALDDALKQGKSMVKDLAKSGEATMSKAARTQMEKLAKIVPGSAQLKRLAWFLLTCSIYWCW